MAGLVRGTNALRRFGFVCLNPSVRTAATTSSTFEIAPRPKSELKYDKVTHTGQAWDQDDYRLVRFEFGEKQVNPNFAINLIAEQPPIASEERIVACDGGHPALGHPKVFINLDKPGNHACGYCGLRFYRDGQFHDGSDHIDV